MSAERGAARAASPARSAAPLHSRSFKLRFAEQREPGRSYVSAVKPLRLPAVLRAPAAAPSPPASAERRALARVVAMFRRGPRETYPEPLTTSNEYGWWWQRSQAPTDRRLRHHIQDSAWLKERLRVLAADAGVKRR